MHVDLVYAYSLAVNSLLVSLLRLMQRTKENDIWISLKEEIAATISMLIQNYPNTELSNVSKISSLTKSIVADNAASRVQIKAVLNLSCLLLKNGSDTPWLNDYIELACDEELDILKKKSQFLQQLVEAQKDPINIMDHSNLLSISGSANIKLAALLGPIIQELVSLEEGDIKYTRLLHKVMIVNLPCERGELC